VRIGRLCIDENGRSFKLTEPVLVGDNGRGGNPEALAAGRQELSKYMIPAMDEVDAGSKQATVCPELLISARAMKASLN
jgi:hypothetical protein